MSDLNSPLFNPFASEEVAPPYSEHWAVRRDMASRLRELAELAVTTDADMVTLRECNAAMAAIADRLRDAPRLAGTLAFLESGRHGGYAELNHELNGVGGQSNPLAPGLNMWLEGERAFGRVTCGRAYEGPPDCVHGGYVAAIFDQFLGMTQIAGGTPGMTGSISVRYHQPTPLETELNLEAEITRVEGRKTVVSGVIRVGDTITASSEALFIRPQRGMASLANRGE